MLSRSINGNRGNARRRRGGAVSQRSCCIQRPPARVASARIRQAGSQNLEDDVARRAQLAQTPHHSRTLGLPADVLAKAVLCGAHFGSAFAIPLLVEQSDGADIAAIGAVQFSLVSLDCESCLIGRQGP